MVSRVWVRSFWLSAVSLLLAAPSSGRADEFREAALAPAARQSFQEHVLKGPPGRAGVFVRQGYVLGFDVGRRTPAWVAYHVKPEYLLDAERYRARELVDDPEIREARSKQDFERELGVDSLLVRLAPLAVMGGNRTDAVDQASYLSNAVPMQRGLAGETGLWRQLEKWVCQDLVRDRSLEAWIVAGCVFGPGTPQADAALVPLFFQIVAVPGATDDDLQLIAFLIPQQREPRGRLADFVVPIDVLEAATGLDFFPELAPELRARLKTADAQQTWNLALPSDDAAAAARSVATPPAASQNKSLPTDEPPAAAKEQKNIVRVFYGTDRARQPGAGGPNEFYGTDRGPLEYGVCEVSVPPGHQSGELERPAWWKLEFREDPALHVVLLRVAPSHSQAEFFTDLHDSVGGRETFVFVHGYNNSFTYAAHRTAQLAVDLQMKYAPIMYSWPSQGSLEGYGDDERQVQESGQNFQTFLREVARQSGASRIHLIAHSMGTRLLAGALEELKSETATQFNEIILAAPDIRAADFRSTIAPRIHGLGSRITVYASHRDKALLASKYFHELLGLVDDATRLGAGLIDLTPFQRIEQVDASHVDTSVLGHAYYGDESPLLKDISRVLQGERPPARRLLATRYGYLIPDALDLSSAAWSLERWTLLAVLAGITGSWLWRRRRRQRAALV